MATHHRRSASTILWIATTLVLILLLTRNLIRPGIGGAISRAVQDPQETEIPQPRRPAPGE